MRPISSLIGVGAITAGLLGLACTMDEPAGAKAQEAVLANSAGKQGAMAAAESAPVAEIAPISAKLAAETAVPEEVAPPGTELQAPVAKPATPAAPPAAGHDSDAVELDAKEIEGDCGEDDGKPPCPMEAWMEKNTTPAVENEDVKALAVALRKIEKMVPEAAWNEGPTGWAKISIDGAKAADAGDFKAAKASCKACHTAWKKKYHAQYRKRKI
jgi:soluble cytochrome b562